VPEQGVPQEHRCGRRTLQVRQIEEPARGSGDDDVTLEPGRERHGGTTARDHRRRIRENR